ncbi:MAG: alpha/beta fold hydrolase [Anaerocolumna sp.]
MIHTTELIIQKDGAKTLLQCYKTNAEPISSILILHGMAEHYKRYDAFVTYLLDQGLDVYIYNHRGHGTDKHTRELGYIAPKDGYKLLISDGITILNYIKKNKRTGKLFLLGHSMGSLVSRCIIQSYHDLDGVILCGTTYPSKLKLVPGILLTTLVKARYGPNHPSSFIDGIIFGSKDYKTLQKRTSFDWLTRNNHVVGAYIHDPYCGFVCSTSFYQDLLKLTLSASTTKMVKRTPRKLPLYLIAGKDDPVGGMGKEINKLYTQLKRCKFENVIKKLYPDCRHELLQELNASEIMHDISHWIKKTISL